MLLFGDCTLDPERRELSRASGAVSVGPQVFDLLLFLVENRTRVVSKDDLLGAVWHGRIVSESTITSHINAARAAIGDNGREQPSSAPWRVRVSASSHQGADLSWNNLA